MDVKQVELYACGKCGKCYQDIKFAEDCCKPYHCEICGIETKRYILKCETCAENARFEKANKVLPSEYKGYLYDDRFEMYTDNIDEILERYWDEGEDLPNYVYGTTETRFHVDIDSAIERAEEDMYEDFNDIVDYKELIEFMEKWNEKQTGATYYQDTKTVVLVPEELKNKYCDKYPIL